MRLYVVLVGGESVAVSAQVYSITGEPPASYILNLRLSNAQRLIDSHAEWSFSEVAYRCGFSDSAHFANAFKRAFGMTPSQYAHRKK